MQISSKYKEWRKEQRRRKVARFFQAHDRLFALISLLVVTMAFYSL